MTPDLDELRGLLAKATPGVWRIQTGAIGVNPWISTNNWTDSDGKYHRGGCILNMVAHDNREHDAALIVAAVNALPALIAEVERLRGAHSTVEAELTANERMVDVLKAALKDAVSTATENARERDALRMEVERLRGDAARYRWLRDHSCPPHNFYISVPTEFDGVKYSRAEVDAGIDAAIAATLEGN